MVTDTYRHARLQVAADGAVEGQAAEPAGAKRVGYQSIEIEKR